eukprot:5414939-Alexandrium_andersonii.AAC.1
METQVAASAMGFPPDFCLYMARHGGVARDPLAKFRSWPEAKARGRWAADAPLRRYAKPGIVNRYLEMCPKEL